jgi:hypothetical protein
MMIDMMKNTDIEIISAKAKEFYDIDLKLLSKTKS